MLDKVTFVFFAGAIMAMNQSSLVNATRMVGDPRTLDQLRTLSQRDPSAAIHQTAQQFEAMLVQQMLSTMRAANLDSEHKGGATATFTAMQDQQYAVLVSTTGKGLGLADIITKQLQSQQGKAIQTAQAAAASRAANTTTSGSVTTATALKAMAANAADAAASPAGSFLQKIAGVASEAAASLGLAPELVLAHAALESGWGKRSIKSASGKESYNLFGIKAGSSWKGDTVDVVTTEYVDGKPQKQVDKFRAYDSYASAFADYADVMKRRFGGAVDSGQDASRFGKALQAGGYATDPQYARKLEQVTGSIQKQLAAKSSLRVAA